MVCSLGHESGCDGIELNTLLHFCLSQINLHHLLRLPQIFGRDISHDSGPMFACHQSLLCRCMKQWLLSIFDTALHTLMPSPAGSFPAVFPLSQFPQAILMQATLSIIFANSCNQLTFLPIILLNLCFHVLPLFAFC